MADRRRQDTASGRKRTTRGETSRRKMERQRSGSDSEPSRAAGNEGENPAGMSSGGMSSRGVTRPMSQHALGETEHSGAHPISRRKDRHNMLRAHHRQTLWVYWTVVLMGFWTLFAPITFGYGAHLVEPAGRETWASLETRALLMTVSDLLSGLLLLVFGFRTLRPNRPKSLWTCCLVGVWLNMAPVLLWAPSAAAYLNGTLVGMLVIALTILIPGMPNMILYMKMGPSTPPEWSYNPSSWPQRATMIALAVLGFVASRYLAAYQLGYIDRVWDPFFGDGTRRVLTSEMSHAWPVSDAALGTLAYTFELLMGFMGSPSRWRTMPWMVTFYGILVIPLGLAHIFLVISQPIVVGEWCTMCLVAAAIMLPMLPLEGDEVIAMGQHMVQSKRRGASLWDVFWRGGDPEGSTEDKRSPDIAELASQPIRVVRAGFWGMSMPWPLLGATVVGVVATFMPSLLGTGQSGATPFQLVGLLVVTVSVIAMGEVFRVVRLVNVPLGLGLALSPWLFSVSGAAATASAVVLGLLTLGLSVPRGSIRERYGSWNRFIR